MGEGTTIKSTWCIFCPSRCRVEVKVTGGRVIAVQGARDPKTGKRGFTCQRLRLAAVDFHYHPSRLNYPLKRAGTRGEGKWTRISWQQAADEIADRLSSIRDKYGPEAVACMLGNGTGFHRWLGHRFCNFFGTPNRFTTNMNCFSPQLMTEYAVYGSYAKHLVAPEPGVTKCMVICGCAPYESRPKLWPLITESRKKGAKLIVIDPRRTHEADLADLWLQVKPGTDAALLFGILNVIIAEGLYDKAFVQEWCLGFEEIKKYSTAYTPEVVERLTWVPASKVVEAARMFATNRPAQFGAAWGVAYSQLGKDAVLQANVARCALNAITGNLDVPGGLFLAGGLPPGRFNYESTMGWNNLIDHPLRTRDNVSAERFPAGSVKGFSRLRDVMKRAYPGGFVMDIVASPHVSPRYLWQGILEGKPYPIKAMLINGTNPMSTRTNLRLVHGAFTSRDLELLAVSELFMTPTAMLADYLLPAADWMEFPLLVLSDLDTNAAFQSVRAFAGEQVVLPMFERRPDYDFWRELGIRLGQQEQWPQTLDAYYDEVLKPSGYTFGDLLSGERTGAFLPPPPYRKYEISGFATASGKVELVPGLFTELGYDPLVLPAEPQFSEDYPLFLITGAKNRVFKHSTLREQPKLRCLRPDPLVQIHPNTASGLGISNGDWVTIETRLGKIRQRAEVTDRIDPRVVHAEHGWWFPEEAGEEPDLFGTWRSNVGAILPDDPDTCDFQGGPPMRGLPCRIYLDKMKQFRPQKEA